MGILDSGEFHNLIIQEIFVTLAIKRIIDIEKPSKILASKHFTEMINEQQKKNINIQIIPNSEHEFTVSWDKILLRFNIGKIPITIPISRKAYVKIKSVGESIIGKIFKLWLEFKDSKNTILFLEFNPSQYSELIKELSKFKNQIVFLNRRRPAISNFESIKLLQKYNCKIATPEKLLNNNEKQTIIKLTSDYQKKLKEVWMEEDFLTKYFTIEDCSIWPIIKKILFRIYNERINEYITMLVLSEKIFSELNIKNIISLNVVGETEKAVLYSNVNKKPSIMLEHAFGNLLPEVTRYVIFDITKLNDRIAVWGESQKKYLVNHLKIPSEKIILCGSPRHDTFFKHEKKKKLGIKKIVITTQNLEWTNAQVDTNTYIRLEKLIKELLEEIKNYSKFEVVIKIHPSQDTGNKYLKERIQKLDSQLKIYQTEPIAEVINLSDFVININSELIPSSAMFDALVLEKPVLNIIMTEKEFEFEFMKFNAVLSVHYKSELKKQLKKFLTNDELTQKLIKNSKEYVKSYLSNPGTSSKYFANFLNSI